MPNPEGYSLTREHIHEYMRFQGVLATREHVHESYSRTPLLRNRHVPRTPPGVGCGGGSSRRPHTTLPVGACATANKPTKKEQHVCDLVCVRCRHWQEDVLAHPELEAPGSLRICALGETSHHGSWKPCWQQRTPEQNGRLF